MKMSQVAEIIVSKYSLDLGVNLTPQWVYRSAKGIIDSVQSHKRLGLVALTFYNHTRGFSTQAGLISLGMDKRKDLSLVV
jgi:hypothetical protein